MSHAEPIAGAAQLLTDAGTALASPVVPPDMMRVLSNVNTLLNASIGLAITTLVVYFFAHLVRWVICGSESEWGKASAAGALRAFFALFIMIDIWFLLRLLQRLEDFSPATAYAILIILFLVLTCWAVLGIGDMFIAALAAAADFLVARGIRSIRGAQPGTATMRFLQKQPDVILRFFVLVALLIPVVTVGIVWTWGRDESGNVSDSHGDSAAAETLGSYAMPLVREVGDETLTGTSYVNSRYGISIEYPSGWTVDATTSSNSLVVASSKDGTIHSQLNAGVFADFATSSREAYLTALWRVEKNIHGNFAQNSEGIMWSETKDIGSIGDTNGTQLSFVSFWRAPDGSIPSYLDVYYVFGKGPPYFTLQFTVPFDGVEDEAAFTESINAVAQQILKSVRVSQPSLD